LLRAAEWRPDHMVLTSRHTGEGGGEEEVIVEFAPLLPLSFRPLMSALYRRLSMGAMGNKGLQGIKVCKG
jgi:hypothetical protein